MARRIEKVHASYGHRMALQLASRGVPVFPCKATKDPYIRGGFRRATTDVDTINKWWSRWPSARIGVPTGAATGFLVVDIDPDGKRWYSENKSRLSAGLVHRTQRGRHLFFKMFNPKVRCSPGRIAKGVDVRAEGGYVIWWPACGLPYKGDLNRLTEPPRWLQEELLRLSSRDSANSSRKLASADEQCVREGGRNDFLSREAYRLRKKGYDVTDIERILMPINEARCSPPLDASEVRRIAEGKEQVEPDGLWLDPTPLVRPLKAATAYPIDALGPILGPAAHALTEIVQVPDALAANTVLAAAALAAQQCCDVETLGGDRPLSLYLLTVAASGDRKSSADRIALSPVMQHVRRLSKDHRVAAADFARAIEHHRRSQKEGNEAVGVQPPIPPRKPWVICNEPTAEGLFISLREGQLSQGVFSDEGATFIGGHALSEDAELRTIGMLSRAWEGSALDRVRAQNREHDVLHGRRLSMHLMAQAAVAARMLQSSLYRSQGYLARWLITSPDSIAGTRQHDPKAPKPNSDKRLVKYNAAVARLLALPISECPDTGGLQPGRLKLSSKARTLLIEAYNEFEKGQVRGGVFELGREWAGKAAEHTCRLAGVLSLVEDSAASVIDGNCMQNALQLARHYLDEYLRLVGVASVSTEMDMAEQLRVWLRSRGKPEVKVRYVVQFGPGWIREAKLARNLLNTLVEFHWLRKEGSTYVLHPTMLRR